MTEEKKEKKTVLEELEVAGGELADTVSKLIYESDVQRVSIKNKEGRTLLDIPVWLAAVGGMTAVVAAPIMAAVGAIGGLLTGCTLEIEREVEEEKGEKKKTEE
jgi:hypothetical protein